MVSEKRLRNGGLRHINGSNYINSILRSYFDKKIKIQCMGQYCMGRRGLKYGVDEEMMSKYILNYTTCYKC